MVSNDRRVRRTQSLLAKALIALTLEKGYDAVTIREITQRADVGYATFFRHYPDKDALLRDVLEVVLSELIALLEAPAASADAAALGTLLFRYVSEHAEICRVLLSTHRATTLIERMMEAGTQSILSQHPATPGREVSHIPPGIAAHHLVASSIALIQWWLEHEMPYTSERMGTIYDELIVRPTRAVGLSGLAPEERDASQRSDR